MMSRYPAGFQIAGLLALGAISFAEAGCAHKTVQAAAPVNTVPTPAPARPGRPMNTAPDTNAGPPPEDLTPPALPPTAEPAPQVAISPAKPRNPRKPSPGEQASAEVASDQPRPPAPQISPELSPNDQATFERRTAEDASIAQKNLDQAGAKQLNASQRDLVEKIRSFLDQSRDASKSGDWTRAQNLAQKARLLSVELINSL